MHTSRRRHTHTSPARNNKTENSIKSRAFSSVYLLYFFFHLKLVPYTDPLVVCWLWSTPTHTNRYHVNERDWDNCRERAISSPNRKNNFCARYRGRTQTPNVNAQHPAALDVWQTLCVWQREKASMELVQEQKEMAKVGIHRKCLISVGISGHNQMLRQKARLLNWLPFACHPNQFLFPSTIWNIVYCRTITAI